MNDPIEGVRRGVLAEWAFAQMYRAMRLAEKTAGDYVHNKEVVANSAVGQREIPTTADLDVIASDNKWYMQQAQMYAAVFAAAELADDSPFRARYQQVIDAVSASLGGDLIPRQRVSARN